MVLWTEEKGSILSDNSSTKGYIHKKVLTMSDENISSVTFAPGFVNLSDYLIAVGLGSGKIGMFIWNHNTLQCRNVITFFEKYPFLLNILSAILIIIYFNIFIDAVLFNIDYHAVNLFSGYKSRLKQIFNYLTYLILNIFLNKCEVLLIVNV